MDILNFDSNLLKFGVIANYIEFCSFQRLFIFNKQLIRYRFRFDNILFNPPLDSI